MHLGSSYLLQPYFPEREWNARSEVSSNKHCAEMKKSFQATLVVMCEHFLFNGSEFCGSELPAYLGVVVFP